MVTISTRTGEIRSTTAGTPHSGSITTTEDSHTHTMILSTTTTTALIHIMIPSTPEVITEAITEDITTEACMDIIPTITVPTTIPIPTITGTATVLTMDEGSDPAHFPQDGREDLLQLLQERPRQLTDRAG